jgi:RNA polymerase sigma-70 factor (sigma-E family)
MERSEEFGEFVVAYGAKLSRTAYLLTAGDHFAAEELLQSALAKTAVHWRRVAEGGSPAAYVRRAMVNERISWARRRRAYSVAAVPEQRVADPADRTADRLTLAAALAALPPRQRAAVVLRFYEDMSEADTAEAMGCSVGTVKSQTHDALRRLRALLPEIVKNPTEV